MEISEEFSESNNRSKRPRTSSSASSSGGGYAGEFNRNSSLYSSPSSSSGISTSTEEDEDMANCLILLARGGLQTTNEEKNKFSRRRSTEITAEDDAATNGKLGIYVYECKTCNRAFPSFQALGGHRASHKRIKSSVDDVRKKSPQSAAETTEYEAGEGKFVTSDGVTPPISTRLMNKCLNKTKIHECSICGSEFGSGQALGGHMRRHRSATNSNTARSANGSWSQDEIGEKTRGMLGLDLNLPATPENDDGRDVEFHDKQPCLVFSAAALVDCHY